MGAESEVAYQRQGIAAAPALFAVDRLAGPRSVMIGGSSVRTLLRPGLRFTPSWEFEEQQSLRRPLPHSVAGIYKLAASRGVHWVLIDAGSRCRWRGRRLHQVTGRRAWSARVHGRKLGPL